MILLQQANLASTMPTLYQKELMDALEEEFHAKLNRAWAVGVYRV